MIEKVLAQVLPPINPGDLGGRDFGDPTGTPFQVALFALNNFVLPILAGLAVMFVVWSGYQFLTSSGDPAQTQKARANLTYSIVGVILVVTAFILVATLNNLIQTSRP